MAGYRDPDLQERQKSAFATKKAMLEKFLAKAKILILATHNKELADRVCNHSMEMEAGRIISRS